MNLCEECRKPANPKRCNEVYNISVQELEEICAWYTDMECYDRHRTSYSLCGDCLEKWNHEPEFESEEERFGWSIWDHLDRRQF